MKKKFLDTNLKFKKKIVEQKLQFFKYKNKTLPLPTEIEISESGTCNRTCSFCPRSDPGFEDKKEFIKNDLQKDYILEQTIDELLQVEPPFFLKIKTLEQTAYTFITDTLSPVSKSIKPNQEVDLNPFINNTELIFTKTRGVSIFINAKEVEKAAEYDYPIRLAINTKPPSIKIQRFKPLSLIR